MRLFLPRRSFLKRIVALPLGVTLSWARARDNSDDDVYVDVDVDVDVEEDRDSLLGYFFDARTAGYDFGSGYAERPGRVLAIHDRLAQEGLLRRMRRLHSHPDPFAAIRALHSPEHIRGIQASGAAGQAALVATAGVLAAIDGVCGGTIRRAFCNIRPPGHHSYNQGRQYGFCYYNHVAIAARYAQSAYGIRRVLIVDWDYHHGDGTEAFFYHDPTVLYFSTHNRRAFPATGSPRRRCSGPGRGTTINVHLGPGAGDDEYRNAWQTHLLAAAAAFKPELLLVSAGFDSRIGDPLGRHRLTDRGFAELTRMALDIAREHAGGRLVSVLEGGYDLEGSASAAAAHVNEMLL